MALVRFGHDSDVYAFVGGGEHPAYCVYCCECALVEPDKRPRDKVSFLFRHGKSRNLKAFDEIDAHFKAHVAAGHKVPRRLFDHLADLRREESGEP